MPTNEPSDNPGLRNEVRLLDQYESELDKLKDQLVEADPQASKPIQKAIEQKKVIWLKQIELVKSRFPDATEWQFHTAAYYTLEARVLLFSSGLMRRVSDRSGNMAAKIAAGVIAKQQEKGNAKKALVLLDQALAIVDFPDARFVKAVVFHQMGQKAEALSELNHVIANFADDDAYVEARKLKDEIENPPKKGFCFVATAAYGSALAPEVIYLSRFRDEVLLHSVAGTLFVRFYYFVSPPMASFIRRFSVLRLAVRTLFLSPLLKVVKASACMTKENNNPNNQ